MLVIPFNSLDVVAFDPSEHLKLSSLRLLEIGLLFILYKRHLLSISGFVDSFNFLFDLSLGLIIAFIGIGFIFTIHFFSPYPILNSFIQTKNKPFSTPQLTLLLITGGFIAPFAEELFFRACLINLIPKNIHKFFKVILIVFVMGIFVLPHINLKLAIHEQSSQIFMWSICSFVTTGLYLWRRSIIPGWIIHCLANLSIFLLPLIL